MFEYNDEDQHQLQSQRFRNLQQSLKVHYWNKLHSWCVEQDDKLKQELDNFLRRNRKAGVNVGRTVLFCVHRKKRFFWFWQQGKFLKSFSALGEIFIFTADSAPLHWSNIICANVWSKFVEFCVAKFYIFIKRINYGIIN